MTDPATGIVRCNFGIVRPRGGIVAPATGVVHLTIGCTNYFRLSEEAVSGAVIIRHGMRRGDTVYRFGPFQLHPAAGRLVCDGQPVVLRDTLFAILVHLVTHAPSVLSKDEVARAGWRGMASNSSVEQAIHRLRKILGEEDDDRYIETVPNQGYRFLALIEEVQTLDSALADELDRDAFHAFVMGRRDLATLNRHAIANARRGFERTIESAPDYAPAHIGLSTACALAFEATRFDTACDLDALTRAVEHARQGATLDPGSADAWSALGFALYLRGETVPAAVAAWKAVALEPGSWRHSLRLAYVSWGEERLEAAQAALALRPHLALAYWLKATVFIARGAFDAALAQLREGCAEQDSQPVETASYPAVGLHLLRGLVLAAQDHLDEALAAFAAELSAPDRRQLYSQECVANTWYARGAVLLRQRNVAGAEAAFHRALEMAPAHLFSLAALGPAFANASAGCTTNLADTRSTDSAIAHAIALARGNRHEEAARMYAETVAGSRAANAGWILPVEPILHPTARPDIWAPVLATVRQRAT